jgi:VanZ family protein
VLIEVLTSLPRTPPLGDLPGTDKAGHIGMYAVFSYLTCRAASDWRPTVGVIAAVCAALAVWGALDEWHQVLIAGRSAEVADWLADVAGVGTGVLVRWMTTKSAEPAEPAEVEPA